MKADIVVMKQDIDNMKQDIKQLNERMDRLETKVDEIDKKHEKNYIELKNIRQIDSNNIAQILRVQNQMYNEQRKMYA